MLPPDRTPVMRIHAVLARSRANGPGTRAAVWVQGCSLRCPGCFNPAAHPFDGGRPVAVAALVRWVLSIGGIEGITVSGGEPLDQPEPLDAFLRDVRARSPLSIVLFTGYEWSEIAGDPRRRAATEAADAVIAGRYRAGERCARGLRGSANKEIRLLTERYGPDDFAAVPEAEAVIGPSGRVVFSGIEPPLPPGRAESRGVRGPRRR